MPPAFGSRTDREQRRRSQNPFRDPLMLSFNATEDEINDIIAILESQTDEGFLTDPAFADPWPEGHPARATRQMPLP